jgi:NADH dehydrogenase (ubiquinone) 1 alpha subcomplex subunit 12
MIQVWTENLTGTRGRYTTYNTTRSKIDAWEPKVTPRA